MPSTAERQKERKADRRRRHVCIQGEAFVSVDEVSIRVDRFLDEDRDAQGYPTLGVYKASDGNEVTFRVAEVKLGKHSGAASHGRCRRCWPREIRRQKQRRAAARAKLARAKKRPARRKPRSRSTPTQGVFSWAA